MIIDDFVEIKVAHKNVKHYRNIGYICNVFDILKVNPNDLPKASEVRVNVKCSNCESINNISYNNYINKQLSKYNFYVCKNCSKIKRKKTILDRYGVEYYSQHHMFKRKVEETSLLKWGVTNYTKTDEYKLISRETSNRKYGSDYYLQNIDNYLKLKETLIFKYGVDNPSKVNGINIEKRKKTNLKKYGFEHAIQNSDVFSKLFRKRKVINHLYYDSTYELKFINYCIDNHIKLEKIKGIKYLFDDEIKVYYPDFYLPDYNLIIEIKSTWVYNRAVDKNIAKRNECIQIGYDFMFIIDNDFTEIKKYIQQK